MLRRASVDTYRSETNSARAPGAKLAVDFRRSREPANGGRNDHDDRDDGENLVGADRQRLEVPRPRRAELADRLVNRVRAVDARHQLERKQHTAHEVRIDERGDTAGRCAHEQRCDARTRPARRSHHVAPIGAARGTGGDVHAMQNRPMMNKECVLTHSNTTSGRPSNRRGLRFRCREQEPQHDPEQQERGHLGTDQEPLLGHDDAHAASAAAVTGPTQRRSVPMSSATCARVRSRGGDHEQARAADLPKTVEQQVVEPLQVDPSVIGNGERKRIGERNAAVLGDPAARRQVPPGVEVVEAPQCERGRREQHDVRRHATQELPVFDRRHEVGQARAASRRVSKPAA